MVVGIEGTDLSFTTQTQRGLDPQFEETATFEVKDVTKDRLFGKFFMNKNTKQIGDEQFFNLDKLVTGKPTFKGIIVPGGKVDMMVTAVDFGVEDKETDLDEMGFMTLDDDADGGMGFDTEDEEEEEEEAEPEAAPSEAEAAPAVGGDAKSCIPAGMEDLSGDAPYKLQVELAMCNVKKIDTKAYGVEKPDCTAKVMLNGVSFTTRTEKGLDPQWDQTVVLGVTDPAKDRLSGKFFMNQGEKQIGDEQFFNLDKLVAGKSTFKGIIVPGGKVDMFVTALNFGVEEKEEDVEDMGFMNTLGDDDEGGMMMRCVHGNECA